MILLLMNGRSEIPPLSRNEIYDEYPRRVLVMLRDDMFIGETRELKTDSDNYVRFVSTVKGLMNCKLDKAWGFEIEFNPSYTKFRKLPYVPYSQSIFHDENRNVNP